MTYQTANRWLNFRNKWRILWSTCWLTLVSPANASDMEKQEKEALSDNGWSDSSEPNTDNPDAGQQEPPGQETKEQENTFHSTPEKEDEKGLVFIVFKESDPSILIPLKSALQAQLSDIPVRLVFKGGSIESLELRNLIDKGKEVASKEDAIGVFWLDANHQENWLLYLVDPNGERVLVRRAGPGIESLTATVESISVITRNSAKALLEGQLVDLKMAVKLDEATSKGWVEVNPGHTSISTPSKSQKIADDERNMAHRSSLDRSVDRGKARIAVAYRGATYAPEQEWQHGFSIWVGWLTQFGIYMGIGLGLIRDIQIENAIGSFSVESTPIDISIGYLYGIGILTLEGELVAVLDITRRTQTLLGSNETEYQITSKEKMGIIYGVMPRGRIEAFLEQNVAFFISFGMGILFRHFDYEIKHNTGLRDQLLSPYPIRFQIETGLAIHL